MESDQANHSSKPIIVNGYDKSEITRAISLLRADHLIGLPTETVYGLGALGSSPIAVRKVFTAKKRPENHPLILHIADFSQVEHWAQNIPDYAKLLGLTFWPGPLTLILHRSSNVCDEITGSRETVAIRVPSHPVALDLLTQLGDGIVAPSANHFGEVSPTTAEHVLADLANAVSMVLDGGPCQIGLESTIIDCTTEQPQLLRAGAITVGQIKAQCGVDVVAASGLARASGMLEKHYAPKCRLVLVEDLDTGSELIRQMTKTEINCELLSYPNQIDRYAFELYSRLRQADIEAVEVVVAVLPPAFGIGLAIRDRLTKAAAGSASP